MAVAFCDSMRKNGNFRSSADLTGSDFSFSLSVIGFGFRIMNDQKTYGPLNERGLQNVMTRVGGPLNMIFVAKVGLWGGEMSKSKSVEGFKHSPWVLLTPQWMTETARCEDGERDA